MDADSSEASGTVVEDSSEPDEEARREAVRVTPTMGQGPAGLLRAAQGDGTSWLMGPAHGTSTHLEAAVAIEGAEFTTAVAIEMAAWPGYSSLSVYDAQTNNFLTFRGEGKRFAMRLLPPLSEPEGFSIPAPTQRGVVLIRRIAPNEADYRAVEKIAVEDSCRAIRGGNAR